MISRKHLRNLAKEGFSEIYNKIWGSEASKRPSTYRKTDRQHIEDVEQIINEKGGTIIDTFRKKKDTEFYFKTRCAEGHDFEINKSNLKKGSWCPKCSKWRPKTDKEHRRDVRGIINIKKGTLLDTYRKKGDTDYYFRILCENGHIFDIRKTELKKGRWCPKCSKWRPKTDKEHKADIQDIIDELGWFILDTYTKEGDTSYYFIIQCNNGHIFYRSKARLTSSKNPGCPECGPDRRPKAIEEHIADVQEIIDAKKGILIETFYKKSRDRNVLYYKIKCKEGHIFNKKKSNLKAGSWCPFCQYGKYEAIIIWYFQKILSFVLKKKIKFDKRKMICSILNCNKITHQLPPKFKNLRTNLMHFDGFLLLELGGQIYNLAVEYQGYQHYKFPNRFLSDTLQGKLEFLKIQLRDEFKRWLDSQNLIVLLEFPYDIDKSMNHPKKIRDFIVSRLRQKLNINIGRIPEFNHITRSKF